MTAFLDSPALIGLLHRHDQLHQRVSSYFDQFQGRIVTTEWVLVEVLNHLSHPDIRLQACRALDRMLHPNDEVVGFDDELYQRAINPYRNRPDKEWALTDCISLEVMTERNLTADHLFRQASFNPLFAPSLP